MPVAHGGCTPTGPFSVFFRSTSHSLATTASNVRSVRDSAFPYAVLFLVLVRAEHTVDVLELVRDEEVDLFHVAVCVEPVLFSIVVVCAWCCVGFRAISATTITTTSARTGLSSSTRLSVSRRSRDITARKKL